MTRKPVNLPASIGTRLRNFAMAKLTDLGFVFRRVANGERPSVWIQWRGCYLLLDDVSSVGVTCDRQGAPHRAKLPTRPTNLRGATSASRSLPSRCECTAESITKRAFVGERPQTSWSLPSVRNRRHHHSQRPRAHPFPMRANGFAAPCGGRRQRHPRPPVVRKSATCAIHCARSGVAPARRATAAEIVHRLPSSTSLRMPSRSAPVEGEHNSRQVRSIRAFRLPIADKPIHRKPMAGHRLGL